MTAECAPIRAALCFGPELLVARREGGQGIVSSPEGQSNQTSRGPGIRRPGEHPRGDTAGAELLLLEEQPALCPEPVVDRRSSHRIWNRLRSTCVPRLNRAARLVFVSMGTPALSGVSSRKRLHETGPACMHPCGRAPRYGI